MIDELDKTLAELLKRELPASLAQQLTITFATPDSKFAAAISSATVNLFLYDVRENLDLRDVTWTIDRNNGNPVRRRPPVRIDCSYLVTVWLSSVSKDAAINEHAVLSEVMRVLLRHRVIPEAVLQGKLAETDPPVPGPSLHPGRLQSPSEMWQALGGTPKAALHYTVTLSVPAADDMETEPLVGDKQMKISTGEIGL
jgi:Pvc16 N-terminal domain